MLEPKRRQLGRHPNEGARLLGLKLVEFGWTQYRLAQEARVAAGVVSKWVYCDRKPDPVRRAWIEDHLGISWRSWDEPPVEEIVLPAEARDQ